MSKYSCAMCSDPAGYEAPYGGFRVPPDFGELLYGNGDPATRIRVDLCRDCRAVAGNMVSEYDTSPLPECDLARCHYETEESLERLASAFGPSPDEMVQDNLRLKMVNSAHATLAQVEQGNGDHLMDSTVFEARVIVLSERLLQRRQGAKEDRP